jgi:hypothetical protein
VIPKFIDSNQLLIDLQLFDGVLARALQYKGRARVNDRWRITEP